MIETITFKGGPYDGEEMSVADGKTRIELYERPKVGLTARPSKGPLRHWYRRGVGSTFLYMGVEKG